MARRGSVKLSILSSYDGKGTDQAEKALEKFAKRYGALSKENGQTKVALDSTTRTLAEMSIACDQAAQRWDGYSKKAAAVGKAFAPISTAAAAAAGASVKLANDYEQGLAKVATIADKTQVPVAQLGKSMLSLSNDTGKAVTEVEEATYQAISASVETRDAVGFVGKAINLAKAGFTDTTTAVDVLTTTINAYGMSAQDVEKISDKLVQTQNRGKTSVNELGQNLGQVIPTAAAYGVSLDNLLTSYVQLTKQGINTANSTTYINRMLTELADSGSDVAKVLKDKTGKSFDELMADGASLGDVMDVLMGSVDGNKTAFANLWSSAVAGKGALAIANAGAEDFNAQMRDMASCTGNVQTALNDLQTPAGKANKAINSLKNTGVQLGEVYLAALAPAAEKVAEEASKLFRWFDSLDDATKSNIATAIALTAAVTPTAMAFSKLFGIVSGGYRVLGSFTGWLARGSASLTENAAKANMTRTAYVAMEAPMKAASVAMKATKIAAGGLALVMAEELIRQAMEAQERADTLSKATDGLTASFDTSSAAAEGAGKAMEATSLEYESYGVSVKDALAQQARLVDSLHEIESEAAASQAELDAYGRIIQDLGGKNSLTEGEQRKLIAAVDEFNRITGESLEVIDATTGQLSMEQDAIREVIAAKKEKIRVEAIEQQMSELYKQQVTNAQAYSDAMHELDEHAKKLGKSTDKLLSGTELLGPTTQELVDNVKDAGKAYDATNSKMASLEEQLESQQEVIDGTASSMRNFIASDDLLAASLGSTAGEFADACEKMGLSAESFEGVSREALQGAVASWHNGGGDLREILEGIGVDFEKGGKETAESFAEGVDDGAGEAEKAAEEMAEGASGAAKDATDGKDGGKKLSTTYADGMNPKKPAQGAAEMAQDARTAAEKLSDNTQGGKKVSDTYRNAIGTVVAKSTKMATDAKTAAINASDNTQGGKKTSDTYRNAIGSAMVKAIQMATDAKAGAFGASDNTSGGNRVTNTYRSGIGSVTARAMQMASEAKSGAYSASDNGTGGKRVSDTYRGGIGSAVAKAAQMAKDARYGAYDSSNASSAGGRLSGTYAGGISTGAGVGNARSMGNKSVSAARVSGRSSGVFMGQGFASGIGSTVGGAISAARRLASAAIEAVKARGREGSPWKTTMESGEFAAEGLAVGIQRKTGDAVRRAEDMARRVTDAAQVELGSSGVPRVASGKIAYQPQQVDLSGLTEQIASLLQEVEDLHGELGRIIADNSPVVTESERDFARRVNRAVNS